MEFIIGAGLLLLLFIISSLAMYLMGKADAKEDQAEETLETVKAQRDVVRSASRAQYLDRLRKHRRR